MRAKIELVLFLARTKFVRYYWARRCAQIRNRAGLGTPQCRGEKSSTEVLRWRVEACPDLIGTFVQVAGTTCSEHRRVPPPAASPSPSLATQRVKRASAAWTARLGRTLCGGQLRRLVLTPVLPVYSSRKQTVLMASTWIAGVASWSSILMICIRAHDDLTLSSVCPRPPPSLRCTTGEV